MPETRINSLKSLAMNCADVLCHQLGQNYVLRVDLLLQVCKPLLVREWLVWRFCSKAAARRRRIPSASGRRPSAGVPFHRTALRWAPSPATAASGWRPSLPERIASVTSSCVLSISLMAERLIHFQLNRNICWAAMVLLALPFRSWPELVDIPGIA